MKRYRFLYILSILILSSSSILAQEDARYKAVQIQLDVLGFAQNGYGIVGGYIYGKNRFDIDLLSNTLFDSFTDGSQDFEGAFKERRTVSSLLYYRYLKDEGKGFYFGGGISYYEYIIDHELINETVAKNAYKPGVYIGYQWVPFQQVRQFSLDVWLGGRWHWEGEEKLPFSNGDYFIIPAADIPLGMIKLGWRFQ